MVTKPAHRTGLQQQAMASPIENFADRPQIEKSTSITFSNVTRRMARA